MGRDINLEKYENAILYLCHKLGGSVFGKKKLYKLLYYVDFDKFEYKESMNPVTGETYQAWKMGPVPVHFSEIIKDMQERSLLQHTQQETTPNYHPTDIYTAITDADETVFTEDEKFILDRVIRKYGQLTGKQLEDLTHAEAPYIATEASGDIDYELAFYRETEFNDAVATN